MAENSAFWLGSTLGDAASVTGWKGPYSDTHIADIQSRLLGNNDNQGFVLPGYNNNLRVYTSGALSVNVATGAAFVRGKLYENTAVNTVAVSANSSGSPRIDRVVIRINYAAQTIRLAVLAGTPNATPVRPTLTQDAVTYEVSLAYIWVANGAASIADEDIHDEREFAQTFSSINDYYGTKNLIKNSEFMGFSEFGRNAGANTNPPDGWDLLATPTAIISATKPTQMSRGRAVQITTNAASEGISQTVLVKPSSIYSIRLLTWVTAGDVGSIVVTTNSASPSTITRYTRRVGEWVEEVIYYLTEADATTMTLRLACLNSGDIVRYGQALLVEGYVSGPFRQFNEIIMGRVNFSDVNWDFDNKSSGTTTIDLATDYGGTVLSETKGVYFVIISIENTSTASAVGLRVRQYNSSDNIIATNNIGMGLGVVKSNRGIVLLNNRLLDFNVLAGGVNSLAAITDIWGVVV